MELEGLIRSMKLIEDHNIDVSLLVTDRHRQVSKWIREQMPDTVHKFDAWHVAKGIIIHIIMMCEMFEEKA